MGVGEVVVVSKTHIFSLNLLPLSGAVWLYGDNHSVCPLLCSNYDKEYYKWHLYVPTDSSPDPEKHPYGAEDPRLFHHEVRHGVINKLLMGGSNSALVRGPVGCSGEVKDCKQACT